MCFHFIFVNSQVGAYEGENVTLNCNVLANPPAHHYAWVYLGPDASKEWDPCYWADRSNIWECEDDEDCDYKKWEGGTWVPYDDPCGIEVRSWYHLFVQAYLLIFRLELTNTFEYIYGAN